MIQHFICKGQWRWQEKNFEWVWHKKKCRNLKMHENHVQVQVEKNTLFPTYTKWQISFFRPSKTILYFTALHFHSPFWCHKTFLIFSILNIYQKVNTWVYMNRTSSLIIPKAFWYAVISILNRTRKTHVTHLILKQKKKASIKNT